MGSLYPANQLLVKRFMDLNRVTSAARDVRIKVLTEVIHALRLVKMLGWEHHIVTLVQAVCRGSALSPVVPPRRCGGI